MEVCNSNIPGRNEDSESCGAGVIEVHTSFWFQPQAVDVCIYLRT